MEGLGGSEREVERGNSVGNDKNGGGGPELAKRAADVVACAVP